MKTDILIVAEHRHIADLWMVLNRDALQDDNQDVRIITADSAKRLRGVQTERTIVIGRPNDTLTRLAMICTRLGVSKTIHLQHVDRLAAGWRTA